MIVAHGVIRTPQLTSPNVRLITPPIHITKDRKKCKNYHILLRLFTFIVTIRVLMSIQQLHGKAMKIYSYIYMIWLMCQCERDINDATVLLNII